MGDRKKSVSELDSMLKKEHYVIENKILLAIITKKHQILFIASTLYIAMTKIIFSTNFRDIA